MNFHLGPRHPSRSHGIPPVLPSPEFSEGTTHFEDPTTGVILGLVHVTAGPPGSDSATEQWVWFDRSAFDSGAALRLSRAPDAWQGTWDMVRTKLMATPTPAVEGSFVQAVHLSAPPSNAADTGEKGTATAFRLKVERPGHAPVVAGGLLRIHHGAGVWSDHWALWQGWLPPDGQRRILLEPAGPPSQAPGAVGDFLAAMRQPGRWWADPRAGDHGWVQRYTIKDGLPGPAAG